LAFNGIKPVIGATFQQATARQTNVRSSKARGFGQSIVPRMARKFWLITEADRSATTVLMPEDY
jgi:hypothetical protein